MTEDDKFLEYTPETLRNLAQRVEDLRMELLFSVEDAGSDPFSEQEYLASLAYLELAYRRLKVAAMYQSRALAEIRR